MNRKLRFLAVLIISLISLHGYSQDQAVLEYEPEGIVKPGKRNAIKVNLTGLPLNSYGIQLERAITRRTSLALGGRMMPEGGLPLRNTLLKYIDDEEGKNMIDAVLLKNIAFTPEVKFYMGKGYGQGFYLSLFYRYSEFSVKGLAVDFESGGGTEKTLHLSGDLQSHTGGFLLGLQTSIAKVIVLDFWFLGPHAGQGRGTFAGVPVTPFSASEQESLREALEGMDIPLLDKRVQVDANRASMSLSGPWGGLRGGISLGVKF